MTGNLELNGEAWKDRDITTYTSILDMYGAADLFSDKTTQQYQEMQEAGAMDQQLADYLFSGRMQEAGTTDQELIDYIFTEELELTKVKNYNKDTNNYFLMLTMLGILVIMLFAMGLTEYNRRRRKRREKYAAEIDMENQRAGQRYGSVGIG